MTYKEQDNLMQRYFDGEISQSERAQVQALLASDAKAAEELRALQTMRGRLQGAGQAWGASLDSDALFARIEAGIEAAREPVATEKLRVIRGGAVRSTTRKAVEWTVFAVAAAAVFGWLSWKFLPDTHPKTAGSEVIEVDFGDSAGKVIEVEGDEGQPLIVVWINDDEKTF